MQSIYIFVYATKRGGEWTTFLALLFPSLGLALEFQPKPCRRERRGRGNPPESVIYYGQIKLKILVFHASQSPRKVHQESTGQFHMVERML